MRKTYLALCVSALALASSPGWALTGLQGSITRLDPKAHQITVDGTAYAVQPDVKLAGLSVGEAVSINVEPRRDAKPVITKLSKIG